MAIADLIAKWSALAVDLAPYNAGAAEALRRVSLELEAELHHESDALYTPSQAAAQTGYHPESICRMIREGRVVNHGTKHRPRVKLADLPKKTSMRVRTDKRAVARIGSSTTSSASKEIDAIARDAIAGRIGRG
ncbi:MAG TPA: hypothetical protein VGM50_13745 [Gemmatimonadaceae bacterium]|jgi:hypothetical protein